jgi:class 3 adenylate cyclase
MCTQCGRENPDAARFCMACAAPLGEVETDGREERKVVSALFCDLVGFTASAHAADPEDVGRVLGAYHSTVRRQIERFGGVVEKFIGDAVVGVWGAPQASPTNSSRGKPRSGRSIQRSSPLRKRPASLRSGARTGPRDPSCTASPTAVSLPATFK